MKQLIKPNPDIFCEPGWCLKYVRQAFGAPAVEPTATAGWANAKYKHEDYNFPNAWVPLWFSMDKEPAGHVVLRAPDGRIYSTSTQANTPYVHPNLDHLIWFYGDRVEPQYRLDLTYLGWSEDISNVRVVESEDELSAQDLMNWPVEINGETARFLDRFVGVVKDVETLKSESKVIKGQTEESMLNDRKQVYSLVELISKASPDEIAEIIDTAGIANEIVDKLSARLAN